MEFVSVRDLRASLSHIWEKVANNEEVVITNHGQPTAFLVHIPAGYFDETLQGIRQAKRNLSDHMNARQDSQRNEFARQREQFFQQHPAAQRQAAFERLQTAFSLLEDDVDIDREREERIIGYNEYPL